MKRILCFTIIFIFVSIPLLCDDPPDSLPKTPNLTEEDFQKLREASANLKYSLIGEWEGIAYFGGFKDIYSFSGLNLYIEFRPDNTGTIGHSNMIWEACELSSNDKYKIEHYTIYVQDGRVDSLMYKQDSRFIYSFDTKGKERKLFGIIKTIK